MLPRESFSKETDAALLSIISYPAFAVDDPQLIEKTRSTIVDHLQGRYGCRRFIRDGYKTPLEDPHRLYYNNSELQQFENIECEWPLFVCFLLLDALFTGNKEKAVEYWDLLEKITIKHGGVPHVPELYAVPIEKVAAEKQKPGSQERVPSGITPYLWAQSLYVVCRLMIDGFLVPAELDPLSRRLNATEKRPATEVQVVILAASNEVKSILAERDIACQAVHELESVFCLQPASVLAKILERLGRLSKMKLTGRPADRNVGLLSTSKFYQLGHKFVVFTPQFMEYGRSHLMHDVGILMDEWRSELCYLHTSWNSSSISGRPLVALVITKEMLSDYDNSTRHLTAVTAMLMKLHSGYLSGARVVTRKMSEFFRTTAVSKLEFHDEHALEELLVGADGVERQPALPGGGGPFDGIMSGPGSSSNTLRRLDSMGQSAIQQRVFSTIHKASMRHRSIALDAGDDIALQQLRMQYEMGQIKKDRSPIPVVFEQPGSEGETPVNSPPIMMSPPSQNPFVYSSRPPSTRASTQLLRSVLDEDDYSNRSPGTTATSSRIDLKQLEELDLHEVVEMLNETESLDEQELIVHYLWTKKPPTWDTELNGRTGITLQMLMEEIYDKACRTRSWMIVRLTAGLLEKRLEELPKAVTHLLVRQKQLTIGLPSKDEVAITCPKTAQELKELFNYCYTNEPNSNMLAQEIIVSLGSLVRTDYRLFTEMFRLRVGLIIQVLASELARIYSETAEEATKRLIGVSPYQLKSMLHGLLSGKLLEDVLEETDDTALRKEQRSGMVRIRKKIEQRKSRRSRIGSMRSSASDQQDQRRPRVSSMGANLGVRDDLSASESDSDEETDDEESVFGVWLRHRRIDGALNRVPPDFYANVWDLLRRFPCGLMIDRTPLGWGLTQEMTRREIKFALQLEAVLNMIPEPEYRQLIVEALTLLPRLNTLLKVDSPVVPNSHEPFHCDRVVLEANRLFVERNKELETVVMDCCGDSQGSKCDGARRVCIHFYDSAPAGECGTAHYMIKAMMQLFGYSR